MRSLKLALHTKGPPPPEECCCFALDAASGTVHAVGVGGSLWSLAAPHTAWAETPLGDDLRGALGATFLAETALLVVATGAGDVVTYDPAADECLIAGSIAQGLVAAAWSPEQDLLVLLAADGRVLVMTSDFDVLCEHDAYPGAAAPGLAGAVSWRGDGRCFATSFGGALRVWDRTGEPEASGEQPAAPGVLAWQPSGALVAAAARGRDGVLRTTFYERNGLRHGEFAIPGSGSDAVVSHLAWSSESDMLAAVVGSSGAFAVQVWTTGNYHWYLKRVLPAGKTRPLLLWDEEAPGVLHMLCAESGYRRIEFVWDVVGSPAGDVVVVDGQQLLVTRFRQGGVVPPPMCHDSLRAPDGDGFWQTADVHPVSGCIVALASAGHARAFPRGSGTPGAPIELPSDTGPIGQLVWGFAGERSLLAVSQCSTVLWTDDYEAGAAGWQRVAAGKPVLSIFSGRYVALSDGAILRFAPASDDAAVAPALHPVRKLLAASAWLAATGDGRIVSLSRRNRLCVDGDMLADNCNSFVLHAQFLIFTTLRHRMCFVPTAALGATTDVLVDRAVERGSRLVAVPEGDTKVVLQMPRGNLETVNPRPLLLARMRAQLDDQEYRSAFLLMRKHRIDLNLLVDYNPAAFLQHCALVVEQIDDVTHLNLFISSLEDGDTTRRPEFAVFFDRDERHVGFDFATKVAAVCAALRAVMEPRKDLLLSVLTAYVKADQVEEALRQIAALKAQELDGAGATASAALVGGNEAPLSLAEDAMDYIVFLLDADRLFNVALGMYDFDLVEMAAQRSTKDPKEYMPFLRELQALETPYRWYRIDKHLGRHAKALQHLAAAGDEHFGDCVSLVEDHALYGLARELFAFDSGRPRAQIEQMQGLYADSLAMRGRTSEAALVLIQCGAPGRALDLLKEVGDVAFAFMVASVHLKMPDKDRTALAYDIANTLRATQRFGEAATVLRDYCNDTDEAVTVLVAGGLWSEAVRVALAAGRADLVETEVVPALETAGEAQLDEVEDKERRFGKYRTRLVKVRETRARLVAERDALESQLGDEAVRDDDMFSDTASLQSGLSGFSGYTATTRTTLRSGASAASGGKGAKRLRNHQRRKFADAVQEEAHLCSLLRSMVPSPDAMVALRALLQLLVFHGQARLAAQIQRAHTAFFARVQAEPTEVDNGTCLTSLVPADWALEILD